jgi:hypothetical protein
MVVLQEAARSTVRTAAASQIQCKYDSLPHLIHIIKRSMSRASDCVHDQFLIFPRIQCSMGLLSSRIPALAASRMVYNVTFVGLCHFIPWSKMSTTARSMGLKLSIKTNLLASMWQLLLALQALASPVATITASTVNLGYAQYQGSVDTATNTTSFLGIRYAAPPVGTSSTFVCCMQYQLTH